MTIGTEAGAWIEDQIFAVDVDDSDEIVELREREITLKEKAAGAIGDRGDIGFETCGTGHGNEETCDLVISATFTRPDVVSSLSLFETLCFFFRTGVLASIGGVLQ